MSDAIKALCKAQMEMGAVVKNAKNPHLKAKYADLGSVMAACFPALHSNGFAIMQPGGHDETGPYVSTVFAHESGEVFTSKVYLVIGKNDMQGVGSAWTYARRYGLLGMAGLAPEDDDGEGTKKPPQDKQASKPPATDESERDRLLSAINKQTDASTLRKLYDQPNFEAAWNSLPVPMQNEVTTAFSSRMGELS